MSNTAIRAENLGKRYILNHRQEGQQYMALRDVVANNVKGWSGRLKRSKLKGHSLKTEDFWALQDVSFEIKQGDRVGIIGRNGAGKSTLLKVLSRITEPTTGRICIKGRVASLLEVGTGFHPELTGRENIYLNGAILGMSKVEIRRKFDEIVAFSEVEKFLDTPVKRYSSGMYVRLAFAVAAHLEPEVLIIDEVLAVGDASFQKKCLGKMEDVSREGRTVLFVSHNMAALQTLCNQAIFLKGGRVISQGNTSEQIYRYLNESSAQAIDSSENAFKIDQGLSLSLLKLQPSILRSGEDLIVHLIFSSAQRSRLSDLCLLLYSAMGVRIGVIDMRRSDTEYIVWPNKDLEIRVSVKGLNLVEGEYKIGLFVSNEVTRKQFLDLADLTVTNNQSEGDIPPYAQKNRGFLELNFEVSKLSLNLNK